MCSERERTWSEVRRRNPLPKFVDGHITEKLNRRDGQPNQRDDTPIIADFLHDEQILHHHPEYVRENRCDMDSLTRGFSSFVIRFGELQELAFDEKAEAIREIQNVRSGDDREPPPPPGAGALSL